MYCINCGKKVPDGLYCIKCGWNQVKGTIKGGPQLVDMYMKWSRKHYPRVTKSTVAIYEHAWTKLESLHKFRVVDIKASHFQDIFDDSCHYSMSYLAKMKQLCKHLMSTSVRMGILDTNPADYIDLYSMAQPKEREIFTDEQIERIYQYAKDKSNIYWQTARIVIALIFSGFRPSEFFSLKKEDVFPREGYFIGGSKTEAGKNRIVPILEIIKPFVYEWYILLSRSTRESPSYLVQTVKNKKINLHNWRTREFMSLMQELGINRPDDEQRITPYSCRHTFASICDRANVKSGALIKIMGHTDFAFTNRVYIHSKLPELKAETDKVSNLMEEVIRYM